MTVWAVCVYCTVLPHQTYWIDSLWASKTRAREREKDLDCLLVAFGVSSHRIGCVMLRMGDAASVKVEDSDKHEQGE